MSTNNNPKEKILHLKHAQLHPGETNRPNRSGMAPKALAELAQSILEQGIVQPLVVRTHRDSGQYEIICGERRWRAAEIAIKKGFPDDLPCIFRELTDSQAYEIRLIENIQREGIHPVEEAQGYQELLELVGTGGQPVHTRDSLAQKIGKSPAYIYARLKLLDMPAIALQASLSGKLNASVALLIARIPDPNLAYKATLEVLEAFGRNTDESVALDPEVDPMSFRQAKLHIAEKYMVRLKGAPFDQEDAALVPVYKDEAGQPNGGGKCSECPFRTGNMKKLGIETESADVCTNTACFQKKKAAAWSAEKAKFAKKNQKLLTPGQTRGILTPDGTALQSDDYVDLREKVPGKRTTWEEALKDHLPADAEILVARGEKNFLVLPAATVEVAAKAAGIKFKAPEATKPDPDAQAKAQQQREERKARNEELVKTAFPELMMAIVKRPADVKFWRLLAAACCGQTYLTRHSLTTDKAAQAHFEAMTELNARQAIVEALWVTRPVTFDGHLDPEFQAICEFYGVDLKPKKSK